MPLPGEAGEKARLAEVDPAMVTASPVGATGCVVTTAEGLVDAVVVPLVRRTAAVKV